MFAREKLVLCSTSSKSERNKRPVEIFKRSSDSFSPLLRVIIANFHQGEDKSSLV